MIKKPILTLSGLRPGSKVYLSGPMSGIHCYNFKSFFYWQVVLENSGYEVINPAEIDTLKLFEGWKYSEDQWEEIIQEDCRLVREESDAIFCMEGWSASKGALCEIEAAEDSGKPIYYEVGPEGV